MLHWLVPIIGSVLVIFSAVPALAAEAVFLHYWTGSLSGGVDEMVATFNRSHPEARIRAAGFEHESFKVGIRVMLASGRPPDLFSYWAGARTRALVEAGHLEPLDDVWERAGFAERFTPAVQAAATYSGRKYLVPLTQHYVALFYNRRLFAEHDLTPPRSWEGFLALCAQLKERRVVPIALGSRERWPAQFWFDYLLLRSAGVEYRERLLQGAARYTDPEVRRAFALWKTLLDRGYLYPQPQLYDWSEAAQKVFHGEAAMTLMGTWAVGLFEGQFGWQGGEDFDFFPFPQVVPGIDAVALGPIDAVLVARGGNVAAAKAAVAYFADAAAQRSMSQGSGAVAPSRAVTAAAYTDLQRRILAVVEAAPRWAFNYDLATPPEVAELGLAAFSRFLEQPEEQGALLEELEGRVRTYWEGR